MTEKTHIERRFDRQVAAARYWLIGMAETNPDYLKVIEAMEWSKSHHNGKRNGGGPEFMHQIEIFHKLRTLYKNLTNPVKVFILVFLHDMVEDGQKQPDGSKVFIGLDEVERRFGQEIAIKTAKLSKEILGVKNPDYSLDVIFADEDCAPTKLADRDNNISSMMGVFKRSRALRYVEETVNEFMPRAKDARRQFPQQESVFENLKSSLQNQLNLIELMMPTYRLEEVTPPKTFNTEPAPAPTPELAAGGAKLGVIASVTLAGMGTAFVGYKDGALIVKSRTDMKHFQEVTKGQAVVMTRSTFEAFAPTFMREHMGETYIQFRNPLKDRVVYVLTTDPKYVSTPEEQVFVVRSETSEDLFERNRLLRERILDISKVCATDQLWVCGGPTLYNAMMPDGEPWSELDFIDLTAFTVDHGGRERLLDAENTVECKILNSMLNHRSMKPVTGLCELDEGAGLNKVGKEGDRIMRTVFASGHNENNLYV